MITLFTKTCKKDIPWLRYSLQSRDFIQFDYKHVIVADDDCKELNDISSETTKVLYIPKPKYGYLLQEIVKLKAHQHVDDGYVMYVDSDVIFNRPVTYDDIMLGYKPYLPFAWYSDLDRHANGKYYRQYQLIVEQFIGIRSTKEFMQTACPVYYTDTIKSLSEVIYDRLTTLTSIAYKTQVEMPDLSRFLTGPERITEFNTLGAYAEFYQSSEYIITHLEDPSLPKPFYKWFWSWGNIDHHKQEIEECLQHLSL